MLPFFIFLSFMACNASSVPSRTFHRHERNIAEAGTVDPVVTVDAANQRPELLPQPEAVVGDAEAANPQPQWQQFNAPVPPQNYYAPNYYPQPYFHRAQARQDPALADPSYQTIETGPWVTVPYGNDERYGPVGAAPGFDLFNPGNLITWGLGVLIIVLVIVAAAELIKFVLPFAKSYIADSPASARSLENLSTLAQYAFEAYDKYEMMNAEKEE